MKLSLALPAALIAISVAGTAWAASGEEITNAQKCTKCHTAKTTKKGPSFADVAAKYKGKADAQAILSKGLRARGKMGEEEDHKKLDGSDDDIKAVVAYILGK